MYQQNPYQQQAFGSQQNQQSAGQQVYLQEQDLANFILSELKRIAREYATAAMEAANPQIRQTFQSLLQKTLQDQADVFQEIQKLSGYGEILQAQQQDLQQELQKQSQTAAKLQSFVQQNLNKVGTGGYTHQTATAMTQQNQAFTQRQSAFQPMQTMNTTNTSTSFPNPVYSQSFSPSGQASTGAYSSGGSMHTQASTSPYSSGSGMHTQTSTGTYGGMHSQEQGYGSYTSGVNTSEQSMTSGGWNSSSLGSSIGKAGYNAAGTLSSSELNALTSKTAATSADHTQAHTGSSSAQSVSDNAYGGKLNEGRKYSF